MALLGIKGIIDKTGLKISSRMMVMSLSIGKNSWANEIAAVHAFGRPGPPAIKRAFFDFFFDISIFSNCTAFTGDQCGALLRLRNQR